MKIGDTATLKKTISEKDINQFARISGDYNPVHVNLDKARESIFGERIAHGMLIASYISTVLGMKMPGEGTIFLEQSCKFIKPVRIGDTIEVFVEFEEIINEKKGIIRLTNSIYNQNNEKVLDGYSIVKTNEIVAGDGK